MPIIVTPPKYLCVGIKKIINSRRVLNKTKQRKIKEWKKKTNFCRCRGRGVAYNITCKQKAKFQANFKANFLCSIRVILQINYSFGWELVVLHTMLSMFSKFLVHAWSWCGGFKEKLLYRLIKNQIEFDMPIGAKMNRYRMFIIQTFTPTPSMYQKLTKRGKYCMQDNQLPTKTLVEWNENSIEVKLKPKLHIFLSYCHGWNISIWKLIDQIVAGAYFFCN